VIEAAGTIRVAVVVFQRDGAVLLVRKRGTTRFMFPGGKLEAGESAVDCCLREIREELGLELEPAGLEPLGEWSAPAANEPGHRVLAVAFAAPLAETPPALGEIAEVRWQPLAAPAADLAPLVHDCILPALQRRR
jgi:8-oxo-dGTP diphosphatase